ncbi:hypothetical protein AB0C87_09610 [Actinomadura sp. NPDC048021]|uniref:hypothetical protein n=1 Tax=Actinomadura sp. NPDC048021 TaxID=3155385 RepID=UPI0033CCFB45
MSEQTRPGADAVVADLKRRPPRKVRLGGPKLLLGVPLMVFQEIAAADPVMWGAVAGGDGAAGLDGGGCRLAGHGQVTHGSLVMGQAGRHAAARPAMRG